MAKPRIYANEKHEVSLGPIDAEIADHFDDYMTEDIFALFNMAIFEERVIFHFGSAASVETIETIWAGFSNQFDW